MSLSNEYRGKKNYMTLLSEKGERKIKRDREKEMRGGDRLLLLLYLHSAAMAVNNALGRQI